MGTPWSLLKSLKIFILNNKETKNALESQGSSKSKAFKYLPTATIIPSFNIYYNLKFYFIYIDIKILNS